MLNVVYVWFYIFFGYFSWFHINRFAGLFFFVSSTLGPSSPSNSFAQNCGVQGLDSTLKLDGSGTWKGPGKTPSSWSPHGVWSPSHTGSTSTTSSSTSSTSTTGIVLYLWPMLLALVEIVVALHPPKLAWNPKWKFGRCFSFANGWFLGSHVCRQGCGTTKGTSTTGSSTTTCPMYRATFGWFGTFIFCWCLGHCRDNLVQSTYTQLRFWNTYILDILVEVLSVVLRSKGEVCRFLQ